MLTHTEIVLPPKPHKARKDAAGDMLWHWHKTKCPICNRKIADPQFERHLIAQHRYNQPEGEAVPTLTG